MGRFFFIAKNNMKKQKGDMITFFIMTFLASFMIFTCLNLAVGTYFILDKNAKKINGVDMLFMLPKDSVIDNKLTEILQGNDNIGDYEQTKYISANAKYRKKGKSNWADYSFYISSYEDECRIHIPSIDVSKFSGKEIVIPVSLSTNFSIGDLMELKFGDNIYEFRVAGYNEDFVFCSPMSLGAYHCFISEKCFQEILYENRGVVSEGNFTKTKMSSKAVKNHVSADEEIEVIFTELNDWMLRYKESHPEYTGELSGNFVPGELIKLSNMILPFMFIAIVLVFAVIILAVAFVIIDFSVKNFIMDNMKNTGIMEAGGYTVKEMIFILWLQIFTVSLVGSVAGAVLGLVLQKYLGIMMLFLVGLEWSQGANILLALGTVFFIELLVTVFILILGREYKKTSVLDALRGGKNTHNFKKNIFAFDKTYLPVPLTLALKETFGKFKGQIGVILIMTVLAFSAAMGFGLYENMGKDVDALLRISGLDISDAIFEGDANMEAEIQNLPSVSGTYSEIWYAFDFKVKNRTKNITTRMISDTSKMREDQMVEGRWPKYENEIAVGTMASNQLNLKVGDTVVVKNGENEASFLVTGIMQTFNNMGMMGYMTLDGYSRLGGIPSNLSINVFLNKGYTFEDFKKEFNDLYPDTELIDVYANTGSLFSLLNLSMKLIMILIMVVTAFIVALAEALLVRTQITKEWRNLGVNKALGFTSNQLILQLILSNLPSIIIGIVLGLVFVTFFGGKTVLLMFSIFGFRKVQFVMQPISYVLVVLIITGVAVVVSLINGKRIKELEPVKMITEE